MVHLFPDKQREIMRYWLKSISAFFYPNDLSKLARLYGTDKYEHDYCSIYEHLFREIKYKKLRILEIGIGGGANTKFGGNSLKMWAKYFPNGEILGIDLYDKSLLDYRRIKTYQGNQTDEIFLSQFQGLDIVIDDGGHVNPDVIKSFEILFPRVNEYGFYIIEDVENSYWQESGGNEFDLDTKYTIMGYFKSLADGVNLEFMRREEMIKSLRNDIGYIHFYQNLIVIQKRTKSIKNFSSDDEN